MLVDSHCHLNYKGIVEQQGEILTRARQNGVTAMLNISTRESEWGEVIGLAEQEKDIWASVGIHPHEADAHPGIDAAKLIERAENPRVIAIGETGLDYYYDKSDRERQKASFREHIEASRVTGLPIIIHTREAEKDTLDILTEEMGEGRFPALIHCFTASSEFAESVLKLGLYISFSGIVTFKNAEQLREVASSIPMDKMLVETDAPFLAPVPHRGKTGEPAFVSDTARYIAGLRDMDAEELFALTSDNFYRLFSKAKPG